MQIQSMCLDMIIFAFCVLRPRLDFHAFQPFFFFLLCAMIVDLIQCEQCTPPQLFQHILINFSATFLSRDPQISLFNNFFIKNWSHGTIHTFKNYFVTVFSVFSFSKISSIQMNQKSTEIGIGVRAFLVSHSEKERIFIGFLFGEIICP